MRTTRTVLLAAVAGALTVLGGCASGAGTQSLAPPTSAPAAASASPSAAPATATGSGGKCTTAGLRPRLVVRPDDLGAHRAAVVWTNTSGRTCTMYGFGGVDLDGPNQRTFGPTYHLPRSDEQPATVTLVPGGSAQTVLNYLSPEGAPDTNTWIPDHALVTPPDETHSVSLPWSFGAVVRQDAATHPGTFLHPVTAAPDPDPAACTSGDLSAGFTAGDAGAGNRYTTLRLSAQDGHRCTLAGPLPILLQNAGKVIVYREPGPATAPTTTVVDAAHPASVQLHWTVANQPQVTPGALSVRLPGTTDTLTVPWNAGPVDASETQFSITAGPVASGS